MPSRDDSATLERRRGLNADWRFLQSREWRERVRPAQLDRQPLCEHCTALGIVKAAEQVDHVIRPRGDKTLQRDPANLQSLCASHHLDKSNWERHRADQPLVLGVAIDGWPIEAPGGRVRDQADGPLDRRRRASLLNATEKQSL